MRLTDKPSIYEFDSGSPFALSVVAARAGEADVQRGVAAWEGDAPYLLSVDRAQSVRDYLVGRFRRQTVMPMGEDAASSPRDDKRWSGVALAMFVRNDAITRSSSQRNGRQATP